MLRLVYVLTPAALLIGWLAGSAGIGMFLLRLLKPGGRLFYEFDALDNSSFEAEIALPELAASRS